MFIFCCRNIDGFDYGVLPQTHLGVRGNRGTFTGWALAVVAKWQSNHGVVPAGQACKVKSLAAHLAESEKQRLPRRSLRLESRKVRDVAKF